MTDLTSIGHVCKHRYNGQPHAVKDSVSAYVNKIAEYVRTLMYEYEYLTHVRLNQLEERLKE